MLCVGAQPVPLVGGVGRLQRSGFFTVYSGSRQLADQRDLLMISDKNEVIHITFSKPLYVWVTSILIKNKSPAGSLLSDVHGLGVTMFICQTEFQTVCPEYFSRNPPVKTWVIDWPVSCSPALTGGQPPQSCHCIFSLLHQLHFRDTGLF